MKIKIQGELPLQVLAQAIFEQLAQVENRFLISHSKEITLYFTPTNGFGKEVYCQDETGKEVKVMFCHGPYRSAADEYDS